MPEKKIDTANTSEVLEKRIKAIENNIKDIKKLSIANFCGRYDEDVKAEISEKLNSESFSKRGFLKENIHLMLLMFVFAILVFNFLTFAVITGKGLTELEKVGIKLDPLTVAGPAAAQPKTNEPKFVKTSIDDDAILGDPNAPVTMIEFSDYDCPFCKSFHQTTFQDIKKDYVDTGKVRFVYRDLPIKQLHPLAYEKALAINCAREQGGDEMYYSYHDEVFSRSVATQKTLEKVDLKKIAADLRLNTNQFDQCLDTAKYGSEVDKDLADAVEIEAFGTPTFIIGKTVKDGSVDGRLIEGAAPYPQFQQILDEYLNK